MFPEVEPEFASVDIRARGDLVHRRERTRWCGRSKRSCSVPTRLENVYAKTGASGQGAAEDQIGSISLNFVDWDQRRPADTILQEVRDATSGLAGINVEARKPQNGPEQGKPISIELSSRFPSLLTETVGIVRDALAGLDGVINVEDTRPLPGIEWQIDVNRAEAARFGADITLVGNMIQLVTNGIKVGEYRPDDADDEIDIRVRYPYDSRNLAQIDELRIPTANGLIPISNFVERVPAQKVSTIQRTPTSDARCTYLRMSPPAISIRKSSRNGRALTNAWYRSPSRCVFSWR